MPRAATAGLLDQAVVKARASLAPAGARPQLKVVLGGGSGPVRFTEGSIAATHLAHISDKAARLAALSGKDITPLGHAVAHSGAQAGAQQSMSWCSPCIWSLATIGQSDLGTADTGPDDTAKASARTIRVSRRRITFNLIQAALTNNYGGRTFNRPVL